MTPRQFGPGAVTRAQGEIVLARAAAIRDVMATGATHDEARLAVDDAFRTNLAPAVVQVEAVLAAWSDAIERVSEYIGSVLVPAVASAVRGLGAAHVQSDYALAPPGHPEPDDDRWAAALRQKRSGHGAGPRPPRMDRRQHRG